MNMRKPDWRYYQVKLFAFAYEYVKSGELFASVCFCLLRAAFVPNALAIPPACVQMFANNMYNT